MTNTAQFKLATLSRQAFEMGLVRVPGDRDTQRDLQKIRRTVTATGKPSFRAQRDKEGHADRTWAMMLSLSAAEMPILILPEFAHLRETSESLSQFQPSEKTLQMFDFG